MNLGQALKGKDLCLQALRVNIIGRFFGKKDRLARYNGHRWVVSPSLWNGDWEYILIKVIYESRISESNGRKITFITGRSLMTSGDQEPATSWSMVD